MNEQTRFYMCDRKKRYKAKKNAENQLKFMRKKGIIIPMDAHAYQCPYCSGWHLGHAPNPLTIKELEKCSAKPFKITESGKD